ncbi:biopolymer transporter ExbD [uncultured Parasphingopyxis sp.]|uniref:ExbD/TolR family protein n=1 Tax=uncultured Parasphingopyxis sp. TaxID=1547918 RepID=UPI00262222B6|nr:biopolymer transporter ExbD [uncultured Parasphingopyxis sp.]
MAAISTVTIGAPRSDINMTPLIDVMLVLLIMFIIALPIVTHKVPVTLPTGQPAAEGTPPPSERLTVLPEGAVLWNGTPIGDAELEARLERVAADGNGLLVFEADGSARYERVDHLLALVARSGVERMAFAGNREFAAVL